jgi:dolichol kinase
MSKKDALREIYRKVIHALGILWLLPLIFLGESLSLKVFAVSIIIALFLHWYWDRRNLREKYLKQMVAGLPVQQKRDFLKGTNQIKKFEEEVLFGFLKDVTRRKEKEPLLATFYYLLSTFLALVLLGVPFAIFGLFAISIGDAAATLVGKYVGRHKLLWNKEKSIEGWIGFFAATALSLFIFLQFMPQFAIFNPLWLAIAVGITGATIETIPIVNDNTIIPLGTGLVLWLLSLLL